MQQNDQESTSNPTTQISHSEEIRKAIEARSAAFQGIAEISLPCMIKRLKERKEQRENANKENTKED